LEIPVTWDAQVTTLRTIAETARRSGLEFIVCGGYAVNAYQVIRKTGDIDIVIRERDAGSWKERLLALGYSVFHESGAFVQFRPDSLSSWPVDLILVDERTFDAMKSGGMRFPFGDTECFIPSVEHLIAMKLHALRYSGEKRIRQDALDIIDLAERAEIDLAGERFRDLCERFANPDIHGRILAYAGKTAT
jgi:hypothetical protein